jgi:hypothetical protein
MASSKVTIVSCVSKQVMFTQCKGEVIVNEVFELLKHNSENVMNDNMLNLQKDMFELNFLLKSANRCNYSLRVAKYVGRRSNSSAPKVIRGVWCRGNTHRNELGHGSVAVAVHMRQYLWLEMPQTMTGDEHFIT